MSLKIWLPLKGDLHNQGSSKTYSTQTTGYTIESNGKIGSCIKFSSVFDTQIPIEDWDYVNKSVSFCCWAKISKTELETLVNSYSYDSRYSTAGGTLIGRDSYGGFSIRWKTNNIYNDGQLKKIYAYTHIRNTSTNQNTTTEYEVPFDTWFHVAAILDRENSKLYFYVNGNLVANSNFTITGTFSTGTFLIAQSSWDGGNGNASFGTWMLNDVRVYDHCLSALEVKEISQGLVLHYPLNRQGWGQENLVTNSSSEWSSWVTPTVNGTNQCSNPGVAVLPDDKVSTDKFACQVEIEFSGVTIGTDGTCAFRAQGAVDSGWSNGTNPWTKVFFSGTAPSDGVYKYTWIGSLNDTSVTHTNFNCGFRADYWGSGKYRVRCIKVEKGSVITPWCPHSNQTIYTTLGLNGTTEYDCSGFCNNGEKIGVFTYTSDTPKYSVSTHIGATSQKIHISGLNTSGFGNSYSFSWWGKRDSNSPMFWGFSDGIRLNGMYTGTLWNTGDSSNNPIYQPGTTTTITAPSTNTWHHYVMTGDGTTCKLYVDGVLYGQAKTYKAISGTSIYINGWDSNTSYSSTNTDISDFRIYATALSAEDIKALYETSMSIDNLGQIHGFKFDEFSESQIQSIGKNGIINCKELIEDDGAHFYENGSIEANNFIEK